MRLPIKHAMLERILQKTMEKFSDQPYLQSLYCALFATAYYRLFRVGELTSGSHPVQVRNIKIETNKDKILFVLLSSKTHGEWTRPQTIKISALSRKIRNQQFCPFQLLCNFLRRRPKYRNKKEPFFVFSDNSPVKPVHMRNTLKEILQLAGFDKELYNCQSFRIGHASQMLQQGISVETIKKIGRWTSNAVFTYLRNL